MSALGWGLLVGVALPLGAAAGIYLRLPRRAIAAVLAFGSGTLIAALSMVLMEQAWDQAGVAYTAAAFLAGALAYTAVDFGLQRSSAGPKDQRTGLAIAAGSFLDNVPEALVIGASTIGGGVGTVLVAGVWLSNFPEGLASAERLRRASWSAPRILGLWSAIGLATALATWAGAALFATLPAAATGAANAAAAGAVVTMLADELIPQAYAEGHDFAGFITAAGLLLAFVLHKVAA